MPTKIPYWQKLKDPRWQKMRLQVMERDKWTCQDCGEKDETLNVHHTYYLRGKEPWDYPLESYLTLCEGCHESAGEYSELLDSTIKPMFKPSNLLDVAYGFHELKKFVPRKVILDLLTELVSDDSNVRFLVAKYLAKHPKKTYLVDFLRGQPSEAV